MKPPQSLRAARQAGQIAAVVFLLAAVVSVASEPELPAFASLLAPEVPMSFAPPATMPPAGEVAVANGELCSPTACGEHAIFPVLQGRPKGEPIRAGDGEVICVQIMMQRNPVPVDAFGYAVTYDPERLTLLSIQRGSLVASFLAADCNQPAPGILMCSGFSDEAIIPVNSSGVLATLCFRAQCPRGLEADSSVIQVENLQEDLLALEACCNFVICANPDTGPCAGKALYLQQPGAEPGAPVSARRGEEFTLSAGLKELASPVDSFSFVIDYDPASLKFISARPGELLANFIERSVRETTPGRLLCTGFNNLALPPRTAGPLFHLTFAAQCVAGDTSLLAFSALQGDFRDREGCDNIFVCKSCDPGDCNGPALYLAQSGRQARERLREQPGDSLRVEVRLKSNPQSVGAFGFRLHYDPAHLSFGRALRGNLTSGFIAAAARLQEPGTLVCAGFGTTPVPANSDGALLELRFAVHGSVGDSSEMRISALADDVAALRNCCNVFVCIPCEHDGDVNSDKRLTSGDALCAFETYLNGGVLPAGCNVPGFACELVAADVNCDNSVTARDALAIFTRALQGQPPRECFAQASGTLAGKSPEAPGDPVQLQLVAGRRHDAAQDTVSVLIQVSHARGLAAFGLVLQYPSSQLQFAGARRTTATQDWRALEGREYLPGMVVVGGFHPQALANPAATGLVELLFRTNGYVPDHTTFSLSYLTDDLQGAHVTTAFPAPAAGPGPQHFRLYQNYPNPLRLREAQNTTTIQYELPSQLDEATTQVEVTIYNLQGQVVRRLFSGSQPPGSYLLKWDGRSDAGGKVPAGTYQYRLRAGTRVAQRQLLVVK